MDGLLILILALVVINFMIDESLGYLNNMWRKKPVPADLRDVYSAEKYYTYQQYKKENYRLAVITSFLSLSLTLIMLLVGFKLLDQWLRSIIGHEILLSIMFFGLIGLASDIIFMPFAYYQTFVIEQKYGFNTMTNRTFFLDKLKSYFLTIIIGVPVLYLIIWLYSKFGPDFWWMVWIFVSILSVAISFLYSNVIVPLFNKQTPLEEGELRNRIKELAELTDFKLDKVFVIDGSKRSTRANAYFAGFGAKKRIVLYDTLIKTQSLDEIVSVLAHEIGHYKHKHTIKGIIASIIQTGLLLFLFSLIIDNPAIYAAIGIVPGFHIGLIVFFILYSPVSFLISFGTNYISRKYEYQADKYAADKSSGIALISALKSLTSNNMSDLTPHPLYVWAHYSHPTLLQRIIALKK